MDGEQGPPQPPPQGGPIRKSYALAFATVAFIALEIAGLGMTTLLLDEDVVAASGLGPWPAIASTGLATIVFAAGLALALRAVPPSYWSAAWIALATALAYVAGAWFGCLFAAQTSRSRGRSPGASPRAGSASSCSLPRRSRRGAASPSRAPARTDRAGRGRTTRANEGKRRVTSGSSCARSGAVGLP
jgi:hypothetical protein